MKKFTIGMFALALFSACSNENELPKANEAFEGDQAYMAVQLLNSNEATRGTDDGFQYGTADENEVNTVEFYFYNADGSFNQHTNQVLTWNAGTTENVEEFSTHTVVLQGLKAMGVPRYVVAVLNGTDGEYKGLTLTELKEKVVNSYLTGNYYMMTNSTYNHEGEENADNSLDFATVLQNSNFLTEAPTKTELTQDNAVQIYVERLAAKVSLATSQAVGNSITLTEYEVDGEQKDLKINILNWGLNALTKDSYTMKRVPYAWTEDLGFTWDDKANYRSYWAASTNYNVGTYPASYGETVDAVNDLSNIADKTLTYVSWNNIQTAVGTPLYCMENTNTKSKLEENNFKATATHVLIKAQIEGGENLVRYYGQLYTPAEFIKTALGQVLYYKVATDGANTTYTKIAPEDVQVKNAYDGKVVLELKESSPVGYSWSATTGTTTSASVDDVNKKLSDIFETNIAEYYKDGMMYYCIPIEHLRNGKITYATNGTYTVNEGDYGVVRNHWYNITVNKIENLGTSVYDPEEEIVPNVEQPTYYVGASINILAWKIVNQNVEL